MSLQEWERDIRNRQRNIVFPDTNLNEGRFYRNIASGKAVFSRGQKVSLVLIVAIVLVFTSIGLAEAVGYILAQRRIENKLFGIWIGLYPLAILYFWVFLAVKGLLPARQTTKRRKGYRRSGKA
jgi:hypothetical protein